MLFCPIQANAIYRQKCLVKHKMSERFIRNEMLFGSNVTKILAQKNVVVFGVGGVGGYVVESLVRAGVGNITVVDNDTVDISNTNRQIIALQSTLGKNKVDVIKERIADINPQCNVTALCKFFLPENSNEFDFNMYDYIVDAVDTVSAKIELAVLAQKYNVPIISSMGTGNKLDATAFEIADIYDTCEDALARVMRTECRKNNIESLKVVYSREKPLKNDENKRIPSSNSFVPAVAGFIIGGEVIKDLIRG